MTLTATVVAADHTRPAGSVQFEVGGTVIGAPVAVNASGVATITTTFASAGPESVSAVFTPTGTKFKTSTGKLTLTVNQGGVPASGMIPLAVVIPSTGAFTLTVDTATLAVSGPGAAAVTTPITVSDTRNTYPGWSVSGQDAPWSGSGDQGGWTPTSTGRLPQGVTLGSPVTPVSPGPGSASAILAAVYSGRGNGYGTSALSANLAFTAALTQQASPYTRILTISVVATDA